MKYFDSDFSPQLIKNVKTILAIQKQVVSWIWPMGHSLQTPGLVSPQGTKVLTSLASPPISLSLTHCHPATLTSFLFCKLTKLVSACDCLCCPSAWNILPSDVSMACFLLHDFFGSQLKCQVITGVFPDTPVSKWASIPQPLSFISLRFVSLSPSEMISF